MRVVNSSKVRLRKLCTALYLVACMTTYFFIALIYVGSRADIFSSFMSEGLWLSKFHVRLPSITIYVKILCRGYEQKLWSL